MLSVHSPLTMMDDVLSLRVKVTISIGVRDQCLGLYPPVGSVGVMEKLLFLRRNCPVLKHPDWTVVHVEDFHA